MKRKSPTMAEKLAATLLELQRLRGNPIDRDHAKEMSAAQICSLFHFDHAAGYACHGADNHPTGLTPLLIADHREKTANDVLTIAKGKRLKAENDEFKAKLLAKGDDKAKPTAKAKQSKMQSRGFSKATKAKPEIKDLVRTDGSICMPCAHANGAKWPSGHLATHWNGVCNVCGKISVCCAASDWDWPSITTVKAGREF